LFVPGSGAGLAETNVTFGSYSAVTTAAVASALPLFV